MRLVKNCLALLLLSVMTAALASCSALGPATTAEEPVILDSPADVSPGRLASGLDIRFIFKKIDRVTSMPTSRAFLRRAKQGRPIPNIDHKFGDGEVFDSGQSRLVLCYMQGYIHFPEPGKYYFQANSNDGFRLLLNEKIIMQDPGVHADRLSRIGYVRVGQAGWYDFFMQYFQKKGTSTIQLFWKKPGDADFSIVPPEVFRHKS